MPIKQTTSQSTINNYIEEQMQKQQKALIYYLSYVGKQCVNKAKNTGSYKDRTGNLRGSIGYVIVKNGKIIEGFTFTGSNEGAKKGSHYAKELAVKHNTGIVLIVVAGMNYAKYISAKKYDVLDSAETLANKLMS